MPSRKNRIVCDGFGCDESHPIDHECLGEEFFATGRWLGWLYLDLNRPDLMPDILRFCSVGCCSGWLDWQMRRGGMSVIPTRPSTPLDEALRAPYDEVARARAGLTGTDGVRRVRDENEKTK